MLRLCDVSMYYQNGTNVTVGVQNINLEFRRGEFVVITGESGGGKSTLLNVISSLSPYHDGEMYFNGRPTSDYDAADWERYRRDHIGFIFQDYSLIDSYTVLQNVSSAALIKGNSPREAKEKAHEYLRQVGLEEFAWRRASKLSSGQKQRLAIARALAKETDVIIADEPTGNLDSKNGRQIVELLAEIAKERLVIMVSHNIEEAEQYATRRIRMANGNVIEDVQIRKANAEEAEKLPEKADAKGLKVKRNRLATRLTAFNFKAQLTRSAIISLFMAIAIMSSFVLMGMFISNMDDTPARVYESKAFLNGDNTRIVVRRTDGMAITDEDVEYLRSLSKVVTVDKYDYANDCCYYWREGQDFKYTYQKYNRIKQYVSEEIEIKLPHFYNHNNFVRSASSIDETFLSAGRLPENSNEVVVFSYDESILGKTFTFYFADRTSWGNGQYCGLEMTVVGLLKEKTSQVYFHDNISKAFIVSRGESMEYSVILKRYSHNTLSGPVYNVVEKKPLRAFPDATLGEATIVFNLDMTIDDPLLSKSDNPPKDDLIATADHLANPGDSYWSRGGNKIIVPPEYDDCGTYYSVLQQFNKWGGQVFLVDEASFERYFAALGVNQSLQASVYVEDYAYAVDVIGAINASGEYSAISPYRIGSSNFDKQKVKERLVALIVSLIAFAGVFVLEVIIMYNLLKLKRKDYAILKSLGLTGDVVRRLNYMEMLLFCIIAMVLSTLVMGTLWLCKVPMVTAFTKYYRWYHLVIVAVFALISSGLIAAWFNRYLEKQFDGKRITVNDGK